MQPKVLLPERIVTVEGFFSPAECAQYISLSEGAGYGDAPVHTRLGEVMRQDIRNNARVIWDDEALAASLWERISPCVPSPLFGREAIGLNERFRFYRYDVGQTFKPHYDGTFTRENGEKSQVTFMIYLNDDFDGGQTRFDVSRIGELDVVPQTGMGLLFFHNLRHEGAPVLSGRKYVLRTDVMYSPTSSSVEDSV